MKSILANLVAGATGAVVATAVLAGSPALADQLKTAAKNSVTSKSIKNATIKEKDLSSDVTASLGRADTALQVLPDAGVTTGKVANGAVTGPKLADGSVTGPKIADDAVGAGELTSNSVGSAEVSDESLTVNDLGADSVGGSELIDGSLEAADIAGTRGESDLDFPQISPDTCVVSAAIATPGNNLTGDLILVSNPPAVVGAVQLAARQGPGSSEFQIIACNNGTGVFNPPAATYTFAVLEN